LEAFVKSSAVVTGSKDAIESLQAVWTGRKGPGLIAAEGEADGDTTGGVEDDDEDRLFNLMHPFTALKQKGQDLTARYVVECGAIGRLIDPLCRIQGRKKASIDFSSGTDRQVFLNPKEDLMRTSSGSHESYQARHLSRRKNDGLR
jgi:hypothetical protein